MRLLEDLVADEVEYPVDHVGVDEDGEGLDGADVLGLVGRHGVGGRMRWGALALHRFSGAGGSRLKARAMMIMMMHNV